MTEERAVRVRFEIVDARSVEAVESMTKYFDELATRFPEGFDPGNTLEDDAGTFDEPHGAFLIARSAPSSDEDPIGCGGVHLLNDRCAEIKRMWIDPDWRGMGLGRKLLTALEQHGSRLGYDTIRLDTNSVLTEAIRMYESAGYQEIDRYNDNPFAKHWFQKALVPDGTTIGLGD